MASSLLDFLLTVSSHKLFEWARVRKEHYTNDPYNSKYINIIITDRCNLECIGCRGSIDNVKQYELPNIGYDQFVKVVEDCIDAGVCYFDLTPVMGEVLLVKDIHKYLDYLENHSKVLGYLVTTNGTVNRIPSNHKKLNLSISLYGSNNRSFKSFTSRDLFANCVKTFKSILELDIPIEITLRNDDLQDIDKEYRLLLYEMLTRKNIAIHDGRVNDNRGGIVNTESSFVDREGICPCGVGSGGAIRSDNNYYYCAFNDFNKKSIIGSLGNTSLTSLRDSSAWRGIVESHIENNYIEICKSCTAKW
jgi:MoaA/NifB/PqqE/SkfB family radical SAM enzyme